MENIYLENSNLTVNLISRICQSSSEQENDTADALLDSIRKFIEVDLLEFSKDGSPPNSANLFYDFLYEFDRLCEHVAFSGIIDKNVIGLGGAFSSGKSSFINSLLEKKKFLPAKIKPTTSVPTYIIQGAQEKIVALNKFNKLTTIDSDALTVISHYAKDKFDFSFGHILKSIFIETTSFNLKNSTLLDTPGYSKPDSIYYSAKTDEKLARIQLNSCNYLLWFIDADVATITEDDIKFLNNLDKKIKKLVIVNKADKKITDIEIIISHINEKLNDRGINHIDVLPFSAKRRDLFPLEPISKYLEEWNKIPPITNLGKYFGLFFNEYETHFRNEKNLEGNRLQKVNSIIALVDDDTALDFLKSLQTDILLKIRKLNERESSFGLLKNEFYKQIKQIEVNKEITILESSERLEANKIDMLNAIMKKSGNNYGDAANILVRELSSK